MYTEYVLLALLIVLGIVFLLAFLPVELLTEEETSYDADALKGRETLSANFTATHANSGAEATSMM